VPVEYRIGCSSWTSPAWNGRFYPPGLPAGERLGFYARHFDSVEVDSTFYAAPNPFVVRGWARKTPSTFRFTLKLPRELLDPSKPVQREGFREFLRTARLLGEKLGAILLQFPPSFRPSVDRSAGDSAFLAAVLEELPTDARFAVELRNARWFSGTECAWLEEQLRSHRVALAWSFLTAVDVPPLLTADWAYLRLIGDHTTVPAETHGSIRVDRSEPSRLWAERIRQSSERFNLLFTFVNNHYAGFAPESVNLFRQELGLPTVSLPTGGPRLTLDDNYGPDGRP
jgi:uncharacterized protein YecE (DUF72 family)